MFDRYEFTQVIDPLTDAIYDMLFTIIAAAVFAAISLILIRRQHFTKISAK